MAETQLVPCRHDPAGQLLGRVRGRAEKQVRGGERAVRIRGRHERISSSATPISSIVVMMAAGSGSRRTVYVSSTPISWTLTGPGRPGSGTARTSDGGAAGGCDRGGRLRSRCAARVRAPAVAPMATAASETMTGFGTFFEV